METTVAAVRSDPSDPDQVEPFARRQPGGVGLFEEVHHAVVKDLV